MGHMRRHWQVRKGQIVKIIDGPMTGFQGEVEDVGQQIIKVTVQVYGRDTPVDLTVGQIELVPGNSN